MNALITLADLRKIEDEPRVHDLRLAEALGFARPRDIRKLIDRSAAELCRYGEVCATVAQTSLKGGRPTREYHLNEGQALLLCMFSATDRAADVRHQLITVFMSWRRGAMAPAPLAEPTMSAMQAAFADVAARLAAVEGVIGFGERSPPEKVAATVTYLPIWRSGRRPPWWSRTDLRAFLVAAHRQMTIGACRIEALRRFGDGPVPSRTAIHRFWAQLDKVRGLSPAGL